MTSIQTRLIILHHSITGIATAGPASPVFYQNNGIKTIKTNVLGTLNMLGLAKRLKARFLISSTSEVYGGQSSS